MAMLAAITLLAPLVLGGLLGELLRRRGRFAGVRGALGCLLLPTAIATALTITVPVVGLWDGVTAGMLCGVGLLWSAHRAYADPRNVALTAGAIVVGLLLTEVGARLFLGTPPAYPIGDGPHLLLSSVVRRIGPDSVAYQLGAMPSVVERAVMQGAPDAEMTERPPSAMVTKEIVCSIAYGARYAGVLDVSRERAEVFPEQVALRPGARRRVLHVGDSMVYGANVARDRTFAVDLESLEPAVQHLNAGISGMAPDDYLVVLRAWTARVPVDLAVMYLFAGNDMVGLDAPHPCSDWESLLRYADGHADLRFVAPKSERRIGLGWLLVNSPPPYLARVLITWHSAAAAFFGAALDAWSTRGTRVDPQIQLDHLEAILRSARDELRARNIAFVVVELPTAGDLDWVGGPCDWMSMHVREITDRLGVPELDATELIRAALARGEHPIQPDHTHFNEEGHRLVAAWLH